MVKKYIDAGVEVAKFLKAATSLAKQGIKKNEILAFARQQFGKITNDIKKGVNDIFEKNPLQKVLDKKNAAKKSVEERKVLDMEGNVIDVNKPIIGGKQTKMETSDLDDILDNLEGDKSLPKIDENLLKNYNDEIKKGVDEIMSGTSPAALRKSIEVDNLMLEYPGLSRDFAKQIANDPDPKRKADMLFMVKQTFKMSEEGKSGKEIIDTFKSGKTGDETLDNSIILNNFDPKGRKPSAMGGRIGFNEGSLDPRIREIVIDLMDNEGFEFGQAVEEAYKRVEKAKPGKAQGGRIGYANGTENMMAKEDYSSSAYRFKLIDSLMDTGGLDYGAAVKEADRIIEIKLRPKKKLATGGLPNILGY